MLIDDMYLILAAFQLFYLFQAIDLREKSTGNLGDCHKKWSFPVDFPWNWAQWIRRKKIGDAFIYGHSRRKQIRFQYG